MVVAAGSALVRALCHPYHHAVLDHALDLYHVLGILHRHHPSCRDHRLRVDKALGRWVQQNKELHLALAYACSEACLLVALDTFVVHKGLLAAPLAFAAVRHQSVVGTHLVRADACPCLHLQNKLLAVVHCKALPWAVEGAAVAAVETVGLAATAPKAAMIPHLETAHQRNHLHRRGVLEHPGWQGQRLQSQTVDRTVVAYQQVPVHVAVDVAAFEVHRDDPFRGTEVGNAFQDIAGSSWASFLTDKKLQ